MNKKVMVAMSGGVDSSVAAALLKQQGYEVCGVTLKLFSNEDIGIRERTRTCCAVEDVEDARSVAYRLGFPFYVFNFTDQFKEEVIARFVQSYEKGETPNPCIDCNRFIKFAQLARRAEMLEQDFVATGHYARVERDEASGRWLLKRPADRAKDQTYVLYAMTQKQLAHTLFPLGGLEKSQVREIADSLGLVNAAKPDSQDICFVKDGDYARFIQEYTGHMPPSGPFVDVGGHVLGTHRGITHYTIGQRRGLGISSAAPLYVVDKNKEANTVTLGPNEALFSRRVVLRDLNWIAFETLTGPVRVTGKTRYSQQSLPATLHPLGPDSAVAEFEVPQRAVTPGQAAVFYDGELVVGGGTIVGAERESD